MKKLLLILILIKTLYCHDIDSSLSSLSSICSRELSRKVRKYIEKEITPMISLNELPETCQLNPKYDMYILQEKSKKEIEKGDWKCNICNKHFKNEYYIDKHMDNKHNDKLLNTSSICLADLCSIFGCNINTIKKTTIDTKQFTNQPSCTKEDEEKNKYKCQVLMKRCFINTRNEQLFYDKICSKIHCKKGSLVGTIITNNNDEGNISYWLLQLVVAFIILCGLAFYALATDSFTRLYIYFTKKSKPTSKSSKSMWSSLLKKTSNKKMY
jgi:hypothetical protein